MILTNLAKAIREQNYYAVVLEFFIVIAGVVIGFQISAWGQARSDAQRFEIQRSAVVEEMRANLVVIDAYQDQLERITAQVNDIRRAFTDPDLAEQFEPGVLLSVFGVPTLSVQSEALSELERLPAYRRELEPELAGSITDWRAWVTAVQRVDQDAVNNRNNFASDWIAAYPGFADLVARSSRAGDDFAPARTLARFADLAADPRLEGILLLRYLNSDTQIRNIDELRTRTLNLIERLEGSAA